MFDSFRMSLNTWDDLHEAEPRPRAISIGRLYIWGVDRHEILDHKYHRRKLRPFEQPKDYLRISRIRQPSFFTKRATDLVPSLRMRLIFTHSDRAIHLPTHLLRRSGHSVTKMTRQFESCSLPSWACLRNRWCRSNK